MIYRHLFKKNQLFQKNFQTTKKLLLELNSNLPLNKKKLILKLREISRCLPAQQNGSTIRPFTP